MGQTFSTKTHSLYPILLFIITNKQFCKRLTYLSGNSWKNR
ncbi:hypothetical protein MPD5_1359 [Melissococcus plutonius DAT561]|nr:hypothetical protein MPD5_1359 [Melissococcus plutonius DAT561]